MEMMDSCLNALDLSEILEHILKFLPMKELHCVARVSKMWMSAANKVKASRRHIAWLLYQDSDKGGVEAQIGAHMEVLSSQPSVAVLFCSSKLYNKQVSVSTGNRKRESLLLTNYMKRVLPPSCRLFGCTADGIIGTSFDSKKIVELECSKAASCLLLPQLEGVDIVPFELNDDLWSSALQELEDQLNTNSHGSQVSAAGTKRSTSGDVDAVTRIPTDKNVRLVLLFLTNTNSSDSEFATTLARRYGYANTVVAGGYGYDILTDETGAYNRGSEPSGLGMAFCGDRLRVRSVILQPDIIDPDEVKKRLQQLKDPDLANHPGGRGSTSVGLVFSCMGRGQAFYDGKEDVESKAFSQLFPGVPLIGFFGGGEIGFDFPLKSPDAAGDCAEKTEDPKLFHSYTSIFVLLTVD